MATGSTRNKKPVTSVNNNNITVNGKGNESYPSLYFMCHFFYVV